VKFIIIFLTMLVSNSAFAADVTVEMLDKDSDGNRMVYSQEIVEIAVGSTVTWVSTDRFHNVEMIASPNDMKFVSKGAKEASITFDTPGIYYYWCKFYKGEGMIGLVVVGGDTSNKMQVEKAKTVGKSKDKLKSLLAKL
tara:strand:+ start:118 stop:534 length:417 start_codon:yes stop_codon:yes gene_type:complete